MKEYILIIDMQGQAGYHFKWFKGVDSDESSITEHNCLINLYHKGIIN